MPLLGQESSPRFHACFSFFRLRLDEVDASSRGRAFERRCFAGIFYRQAMALIFIFFCDNGIRFVFRRVAVKSRYSCYSVAVCRGPMGLYAGLCLGIGRCCSAALAYRLLSACLGGRWRRSVCRLLVAGQDRFGRGVLLVSLSQELSQPCFGRSKSAQTSCL